MTHMKTSSLLFLFSVFASYTAWTDQLAYLQKDEALNAERLLRERELLITFCSECEESEVTLWHINHAEARYTGHETYYEIYISGWPLVQSVRPITGDELPSQVSGAYVNPETTLPRSFPIDLAYAYIWDETQWKCLGKLQGLPCEVRVEAFRL